MMAQTFQYPNLVAGTDRTDWWTPVARVANSARELFYVDFGRPLVVGDVVTVTADLDFDKLDITKDGASLVLQGATSVDGVTRVWGYSNPLNRTNSRTVYRRAGTVLDGTDRYELSNVVGEGNGIGVRGAEFGVRVDYCGGGSLRVRRLMVELNADGAPHAWAPAAGEVWPE
jgi:hypothetical protein